MTFPPRRAEGRGRTIYRWRRAHQHGSDSLRIPSPPRRARSVHADSFLLCHLSSTYSGESSSPFLPALRFTSPVAGRHPFHNHASVSARRTPRSKSPKPSRAPRLRINVEPLGVPRAKDIRCRVSGQLQQPARAQTVSRSLVNETSARVDAFALRTPAPDHAPFPRLLSEQASLAIFLSSRRHGPSHRTVSTMSISFCAGRSLAQPTVEQPTSSISSVNLSDGQALSLAPSRINSVPRRQ